MKSKNQPAQATRPGNDTQTYTFPKRQQGEVSFRRAPALRDLPGFRQFQHSLVAHNEAQEARIAVLEAQVAELTEALQSIKAGG